MKKLLSVYFLFQIVTNAFGQNSDTTIAANAYVGILNQNEYKVDGTNKGASANLRVGAVVRWTIVPKLTYTSFGVIQIAPKDIYGLQVHFLEYNPTKKWKFSVGYQPTLITEQRPFPVSSGGQFETWTQSQIPGAAFGFKTKRALSGNAVVGAGVAVRNRSLQYDVSLQYKAATIAAYYNGPDKGFAVVYDKKKIYSIFVCNNTLVANTTVVTVAPKLSIKLWSDAGYSHAKGELVRYEGGIFKSFELKKVNGLFSFGYDVISKAVTGYIFVYKSF